MVKRIITAAVCLGLLIPTLVFSDTWVFFAVMTVLAVIGVYELCGCIGIRKQFFLSVPTYLITIAAMVLTFYFRYKAIYLPLICFVILLFMFIEFTASMLSTGNVRFSQAGEAISFTAYIAVGFLCILLLRNLGDTGRYLYLLVFIGAWSTDTGAYFAGVTLGKHKLIPEVSPNKTVEGAIGGVLGCLAGFAIYGGILSAIGNVTVHFLPLMVIGLITPVISQIGDLIASYIKREQGIKDYGNLFPGHGGVLDRFDSILAVSQFLYAFAFLTEYFGRFTVFEVLEAVLV